MSTEEKRKFERIFKSIVEAKKTQGKAAGVYAELNKDRKVTGVGVSLVPATRPVSVVPRSEFVQRSGVQSIVEEIVERRTQFDALTLTLLAPALSEGEHEWKFELGSKPIWALTTLNDPSKS